MDHLQLFAVTNTGPHPLPLPESVTGFEDLFDGFALGVYSAFRTFSHNKFLGLDDHLDRTRRSIEMLGWDYQLDEPLLRQALHQVCSAYPLADARVRIDVLAEPAHLLNTSSRVLIALIPFTPIPPETYERGVSVSYALGLSRQQPLAKLAGFAVRRRVYAAAHPKPAVFEHLILDDAGHILEGGGSNFYGLRDGVIYTAADGVLEGITRKIILRLLAEAEMPFKLEAVHVDQVGQLDEAAISGSSKALLPVVEIEGQSIGDGRPGPVFQRLMALYARFVTEHIQPAVDS
jgi:branched-subunit amino acid aminotransferase/4-amino-4-deoxychorismate lyase